MSKELKLIGVIDQAQTFDITKAPLQYVVNNETLESDETKRFKDLGYKFFGTKLTIDRRTPPYYGYIIFTEICVCISWISFLVPYTSYPGRLTPLVTLFLTLVNTFLKIRSVIPTCMTNLSILEYFVIGCILQVILVITSYAHVLMVVQSSR